MSIDDVTKEVSELQEYQRYEVESVVKLYSRFIGLETATDYVGCIVKTGRFLAVKEGRDYGELFDGLIEYMRRSYFTNVVPSRKRELVAKLALAELQDQILSRVMPGYESKFLREIVFRYDPNEIFLN